MTSSYFDSLLLYLRMITGVLFHSYLAYISLRPIVRTNNATFCSVRSFETARAVPQSMLWSKLKHRQVDKFLFAV